MTELESLYVELMPKLVVFGMKKFRFTNEQAEDIAQETFIKAFRFLDSFNKESSMSTWVHTIYSNKAKHYLNTKKNSDKTKRSFEDVEIATHDTAYDQMASSEQEKELNAKLYECLNVLKERRPKGYEVLYNRFFNDKFEWQNNTVKTHSTHALNYLKQQFKNISYQDFANSKETTTFILDSNRG